jgi:hypothetical protein
MEAVIRQQVLKQSIEKFYFNPFKYLSDVLLKQRYSVIKQDQYKPPNAVKFLSLQ